MTDQKARETHLQRMILQLEKQDRRTGAENHLLRHLKGLDGVKRCGGCIRIPLVLKDIDRQRSWCEVSRAAIPFITD